MGSPGGQQPSRLVVIAFRSLALGSSVAVFYHMYPQMQQTAARNAIELTKSQMKHLSLTGVRRIGRQARLGEKKRRLLMDNGAVGALKIYIERGDENMKERGLEAMGYLAREDEGVGQEIRELVAGVECDQGCLQFWKAWGVKREEMMGKWEKEKEGENGIIVGVATS